MKLTNAALAGFFAKPNPAFKAFVVFGVDNGLIKETADKIARLIVPDLNDAFCVVNLTSDDIKENPSVLYDEAAAYSLMGGRKVIRITEGDDSVTESLKYFADNYKGENFVVIAAGNLTKTSKLRKIAEGAENIGSFACYNDNLVSLRALISDELKNQGKSAEPEAISYLADNLGADRAIARSELEKLFVCSGDEKQISLAMVKEIIGDGSAVSIEDAVYAAADGNFKMLDKTLVKVFNEDENAAVGLVRAAAYHFQRIFLIKAKSAKGIWFDEAVRLLYPPVHFSKKDRLQRQCQLWTCAGCERVLRYLTDTEIACKSGGNVPRTIVSAAMLNVCRMAKSLSGK